MWLSFHGAKLGWWQWGWGDGLYAESDWGVWRAPLEVVSADIHSCSDLSVVIHLVRVAGIRNSGSHVTYSFRHAGACCQG